MTHEEATSSMTDKSYSYSRTLESRSFSSQRIGGKTVLPEMDSLEVSQQFSMMLQEQHNQQNSGGNNKISKHKDKSWLKKSFSAGIVIKLVAN